MLVAVLSRPRVGPSSSAVGRPLRRNRSCESLRARRLPWLLRCRLRFASRHADVSVVHSCDSCAIATLNVSLVSWHGCSGLARLLAISIGRAARRLPGSAARMMMSPPHHQHRNDAAAEQNGNWERNGCVHISPSGDLVVAARWGFGEVAMDSGGNVCAFSYWRSRCAVHVAASSSRAVSSG